MTGVFWAGAAILALTYLLFPAWILLRGALRPRAHRFAPVTPRVAILVAAHNEAGVIGAKLGNLLALDYPRELITIVVASDGSTDRTDAIVRGAGRGAIRLVSLPRVGKARALAAAVAATTEPILVFTDANSMLRPDALRELVAPFADPDVGGVAGDQRYATDDERDGIAAGERRYWSLDRALKRAESAAGSAISATGALYAIRRDLFEPPPVDATDDFFISTGVIVAGRRLVFAETAVAVEPTAGSGRDEFARKTRLMTRGLRAIVHRRALLSPRRSGAYALQLLGHKVLRRLAWIPLSAVLAGAAASWTDGTAFRIATIGQAVFYATGIAGLTVRRLARMKPVAAAAFFCLANAAAVVATWNLIRGRRIDRWETERSIAEEAA